MSRRDEPDGYFSKHFHEAYLEDAANPAYPNAIRVAYLAYGKHKANGHARFKQREIANVLGAFATDGTFEPASKYVVDRAIKTAISYGLLAPESKALCLIVPGHRIRGYHGDAEAPCDRHRPEARKARAARNLRAAS
jgi:hypothetical protein